MFRRNDGPGIMISSAEVYFPTDGFGDGEIFDRGPSDSVLDTEIDFGSIVDKLGEGRRISPRFVSDIMDHIEDVLGVSQDMFFFYDSLDVSTHWNYAACSERMFNLKNLEGDELLEGVEYWKEWIQQERNDILRFSPEDVRKAINSLSAIYENRNILSNFVDNVIIDAETNSRYDRILSSANNLEIVLQNIPFDNLGGYLDDMLGPEDKDHNDIIYRGDLQNRAISGLSSDILDISSSDFVSVSDMKKDGKFFKLERKLKIISDSLDCWDVYLDKLKEDSSPEVNLEDRRDRKVVPFSGSRRYNIGSFVFPAVFFGALLSATVFSPKSTEIHATIAKPKDNLFAPSTNFNRDTTYSINNGQVVRDIPILYSGDKSFDQIASIISEDVLNAGLIQEKHSNFLISDIKNNIESFTNNHGLDRLKVLGYRAKEEKIDNSFLINVPVQYGYITVKKGETLGEIVQDWFNVRNSDMSDEEFKQIKNREIKKAVDRIAFYHPEIIDKNINVNKKYGVGSYLKEGWAIPMPVDRASFQIPTEIYSDTLGLAANSKNPGHTLKSGESLSQFTWGLFEENYTPYIKKGNDFFPGSFEDITRKDFVNGAASFNNYVAEFNGLNDKKSWNLTMPDGSKERVVTKGNNVSQGSNIFVPYELPKQFNQGKILFVLNS